MRQGPEPFHIKVPEGHPVELISEDDRAWFEDHPDRLLRLRFGTDGDPGGIEMAALVFCPQDGVRIRMPYTAPFARTVRLIETDTDSVLGPDVPRPHEGHAQIVGAIRQRQCG
jgi:hypothetical protein